MFLKLTVSLLAFLAFLLPKGGGQVLYQPDLPARLEDHSGFQELIAEQKRLRTTVKEELNHLLQTDLSENEKFYLQVWIDDLGTTEEAQFREKYELMDGARRFEKLDTALFFTAESRLLEIRRQLETLRRIYEYGGGSMAYYTIDTAFPHIREELRFYGLQPGERIGEIGAGDERFAACAAATAEEIKYYVNDIDTSALRQIAFHLQYNPVFEGGRNAFFPVAGQPNSTGLENLNLDKIIIRDAFHHFDYPEEMLASLRQSIQPGGWLYLKERYMEDCGINCCPRQLGEDVIKHLLASAGFELRRETTIRDEEGTRWHLLALAVGEEWR